MNLNELKEDEIRIKGVNFDPSCSLYRLADNYIALKKKAKDRIENAIESEKPIFCIIPIHFIKLFAYFANKRFLESLRRAASLSVNECAALLFIPSKKELVVVPYHSFINHTAIEKDFIEFPVDLVPLYVYKYFIGETKFHSYIYTGTVEPEFISQDITRDEIGDFGDMVDYNFIATHYFLGSNKISIINHLKSLIDITMEDHLLNNALVELYTAAKTAIINEPKTLQIFQERDGYGCMLVKSKEEYDNKEFKKTI
jgi:hypothetical protein